MCVSVKYTNEPNKKEQTESTICIRKNRIKWKWMFILRLCASARVSFTSTHICEYMHILWLTAYESNTLPLLTHMNNMVHIYLQIKKTSQLHMNRCRFYLLWLWILLKKRSKKKSSRLHANKLKLEFVQSPLVSVRFVSRSLILYSTIALCSF